MHAPLLRSALFVSVSLLLLTACAEPAEKLAAHFEAMAVEAESHKLPDCKADTACTASRCQTLSDRLNDYLKQHTSEMGDLMSKKGESSQAVSQRIYAASTRIDAVVTLCATDKGISTFKHSLSTLVKEKVGLPPVP